MFNFKINLICFADVEWQTLALHHFWDSDPSPIYNLSSVALSWKHEVRGQLLVRQQQTWERKSKLSGCTQRTRVSYMSL